MTGLLMLPAVLLVLVWLWPYLWYRAVQDKLQVEVRIGRSQAEPGEQIPISIHVRNLSWIPCPSVRISVDLPPGLSAHAEKRVTVINCRTFLWMRQQIIVESRCFGVARGTHRIYKAVIDVNDGFGLRSFVVSANLSAEVIILPPFTTIYPTAGPMREISGKLEVVRWLFPDETLLRGIRDYQLGDPFKHIAWHASARSGQYMTRQFSSSTEAEVCLVVNSQFDDPQWWSSNSEAFDALCSLASTWARWLASRGYRLLFATNASIARRPFRTWHGEERPDGVRLLLGAATGYPTKTLAPLLLQVRQNVPVHVPILLFTSFVTPLQWTLLQRLVQEGRDVTVIAGPGASFPAGTDGGITIIQSEVRTDSGTQADSEPPATLETAAEVALQ